MIRADRAALVTQTVGDRTHDERHTRVWWRENKTDCQAFLANVTLVELNHGALKSIEGGAFRAVCATLDADARRRGTEWRAATQAHRI